MSTPPTLVAAAVLVQAVVWGVLYSGSGPLVGPLVSWLGRRPATLRNVRTNAISQFGAYGFPTARVLRDACEEVLDETLVFPGRTYVSHAIKRLIHGAGRMPFVGIHVPSFACVAKEEVGWRDGASTRGRHRGGTAPPRLLV